MCNLRRTNSFTKTHKMHTEKGNPCNREDVETVVLSQSNPKNVRNWLTKRSISSKPHFVAEHLRIHAAKRMSFAQGSVTFYRTPCLQLDCSKKAYNNPPSLSDEKNFCYGRSGMSVMCPDAVQKWHIQHLQWRFIFFAFAITFHKTCEAAIFDPWTCILTHEPGPQQQISMCGFASMNVLLKRRTKFIEPRYHDLPLSKR